MIQFIKEYKFSNLNRQQKTFNAIVSAKKHTIFKVILFLIEKLFKLINL